MAKLYRWVPILVLLLAAGLLVFTETITFSTDDENPHVHLTDQETSDLYTDAFSDDLINHAYVFGFPGYQLTSQVAKIITYYPEVAVLVDSWWQSPPRRSAVGSG